ncbi:hypothetical protein MAPG_07246 [Magnaporthiopsis poae ATCC 64411]|uniref:Peptidase A1 domain-containing protein n=1 Tax=Magnaporthiopsis poae (strain ATCC 64411 / 73-15) TaxID=644358 RepID=A0A0C4E457_MAGP6|nr:hypothetical protein MAPG_07246 [Magnaporthiopsis poae ATCC 64411]
MPSFAQTLAVLCSAMAVVSAGPAADRLQRRQATDVSVQQVSNLAKHQLNPSVELFQAYKKHKMPVPPELAAYVNGVGQRGAHVRARGLQAHSDATPHNGGQVWLTTIHVGTPPQKLRVVLDTQFSTSWLYSDLMSHYQQENHGVYRVSKSKTAKWTNYTTDVNYSDGAFSGTLSGPIYLDAFSFGKGRDAVKYNKQDFMAVSNTSRPDVNAFSGIDGVLGMGFSGFSPEDKSEMAEVSRSFFDNVKTLLSTPTMGIDMRHSRRGWVDLGVVLKERYVGELSYLPADKSNSFWNMTAAGYAIGNPADFQAQPIPGLPDTAITFLLVPDSICKPYYAKVKGSHYNSPLGGYVFPCSSELPDLFLKMGETNIRLPGSYVNYTTIQDDATGKPTGECFGGLQIAWNDILGDGTKINIFGSVIHQAAYVVYEDAPAGARIGWANKKL